MKNPCRMACAGVCASFSAGLASVTAGLCHSALSTGVSSAAPGSAALADLTVREKEGLLETCPQRAASSSCVSSVQDGCASTQ